MKAAFNAGQQYNQFTGGSTNQASGAHAGGAGGGMRTQAMNAAGQVYDHFGGQGQAAGAPAGGAAGAAPAAGGGYRQQVMNATGQIYDKFTGQHLGQAGDATAGGVQQPGMGGAAGAGQVPGASQTGTQGGLMDKVKNFF